MVKRYCDLCGKEVEYTDERIELTITKLKQGDRTPHIALMVMQEEYDTEQEHYDVCSECSEKLASFLGNIRKDKEDETE